MDVPVKTIKGKIGHLQGFAGTGAQQQDHDSADQARGYSMLKTSAQYCGLRRRCFSCSSCRSEGEDV